MTEKQRAMAVSACQIINVCLHQLHDDGTQGPPIVKLADAWNDIYAALLLLRQALDLTPDDEQQIHLALNHLNKVWKLGDVKGLQIAVRRLSKANSHYAAIQNAKELAKRMAGRWP